MISMKHFRVLALATTTCALASISHLAAAQCAPTGCTPGAAAAPAITPATPASVLAAPTPAATPTVADPDDSTSPVTEAAPPAASTPAAPHPITVQWTFKDGKGVANLLLNPDGSYIFSGNYRDHKQYKDFDITLGLKASTGAVFLWRFAGDASRGVSWSKQGKHSILAEDMPLFTTHIRWHAGYHFSESRAGRRHEYEVREAKREEAWRRFEEAKKHNDRKLEDENKQLLAQLQREELAPAAQAQPQSSSPGGGSSSGGGGGGIVNSITNAASGLLGGGSGGCGGGGGIGGALSSAANAIGGLF
jgi:hypothetical protein